MIREGNRNIVNCPKFEIKIFQVLTRSKESEHYHIFEILLEYYPYLYFFEIMFNLNLHASKTQSRSIVSIFVTIFTLMGTTTITKLFHPNVSITKCHQTIFHQWTTSSLIKPNVNTRCYRPLADSQVVRLRCLIEMMKGDI